MTPQCCGHQAYEKLAPDFKTIADSENCLPVQDSGPLRSQLVAINGTPFKTVNQESRNDMLLKIVPTKFYKVPVSTLTRLDKSYFYLLFAKSKTKFLGKEKTK
jgi:hypothetical protein